jgi:hypothetical protein
MTFEKASFTLRRFAALRAERKKRVSRKRVRFLGKETPRGFSKRTAF